MTDQFSPSGDAAPIPALPNRLDLELVRELIEDIYGCHRARDSHDSDWENGVDVPCDWCLKASIVLRALVPSPQPETPTGIVISQHYTCEHCGFTGGGFHNCFPAAFPVVQDEAPKALHPRHPYDDPGF